MGGAVPRADGRDSQHGTLTPKAEKKPPESGSTMGAAVSMYALSGCGGGRKERPPSADVRAARHSCCDSRCGWARAW